MRERVYLFNGKDLNNWLDINGNTPEWEIGEDGAMTVNKHNIYTKETFGDAHIHVEFWLPNLPHTQDRNTRVNSGVFVHGCYEIQILDSYDVEEYLINDCGALYSQYVPLCNACKPAEEWQSFDIFMYAPRFNDEGRVIEDGRMTLLFNDVCVLNNVIVKKACAGGVIDHRVPEGPLMLQAYMDYKVRFRNIWIERL